MVELNFISFLLEVFAEAAKRYITTNKKANLKFYNEIDDSWQIDVSEKQLYTETNIPEAIEKSAMYFSGYQLWGI